MTRVSIPITDELVAKLRVSEDRAVLEKARLGELALVFFNSVDVARSGLAALKNEFEIYGDDAIRMAGHDPDDGEWKFNPRGKSIERVE